MTDKLNIKKDAFFNYEEDTWKIIDSYVKKQINKHHIESFEAFIDKQLLQILKLFNPIKIYYDYDSNNNKHVIEVRLEFLDFTLEEPVLYENDGSYQTMTPQIARMRHLTYSSKFYVKMKLTRIKRSGEFLENEDVIEKIFNKINFGKIPIMVQSKYCVLKQRNNIDIRSEGECPLDVGGYFIITGNEKIIVTQERIAENKVFVFENNRQSKFITAEIKSIKDDKFSVVMTNYIKYYIKDKIIKNELYFVSPSFKEDVNLFIILRLLDIETDKKMIQLIIWDLKDMLHNQLTKYVKQTLFRYKKICEDNQLKTKEDFINYILPNIIYKGRNKEIIMTKEMKIEYLSVCMESECLPHLKNDNSKKAYFIGYMTRKLLTSIINKKFDNRDQQYNKRNETPGILIASKTRSCINKQIKDMKKSILKELKNNKSGKDITNIIKENSIYKLVKQTCLEGGLKYALATGNWNNNTDSVFSKNKAKTGVSQVLNRLSYQSTLSHLRRVNSPSDKNNSKIVEPRKLNPTHWGYICPAETPEGQPVGLVKNLSLGCHITISSNSETVHKWAFNNNVKKLNTFEIEDLTYNGKVFINGSFIGIHYNPDIFVELFRKDRSSGIINIFNSIHWNILENYIFIYTDSGRVNRPLYKVKDNKLIISKYKKKDIKNFESMLYPKLLQFKRSTSLFNEENEKSDEVDEVDEEYNTFLKEYLSCIEFIDCEEIKNCLVATNPEDLLKDKKPYIIKYTHCEIHPSLMLGVMGSLIPYPDHNQSPRNTYQSAMGKQAMGISMTNILDRMDTLGYVMNNIERPIVATKYNNILNCDKLSNGLNAIVAIGSFTGYNQEDSIIVSKDAIERGFFTTMFNRIYKNEEKKVQSSGKEEKFCKPNPKYTKNMKPSDYDKLDDNGFVKLNTYVSSNDVIIGKVLPLKEKHSDTINYKDCSTSLRTNESGFVDKRYKNRNSDGYYFSKIKIRSERVPKIGDKFSSRTGQKGTIGMTLPRTDMPYNKDGISPDIIMNPHAIPSRMTIGQLLECILGKVGALLGGVCDCTPFTKLDKETLYRLLELNGFNRHGNEILYCGISGKQMDCMIFMGPTYYQRLKHMVDDKMHSRSTGPIVQLTRQPPEGRSRGGGLRFGEMERDCMIAHGTLSFLKESMLERSDIFSLFTCQVCGFISIVNQDRNFYKCSKCKNSSEFSLLNIPYACKLLIQELQGMSILSRINT
jgi:DNA-directed RNA polymerase II subunit RPB2